MKLKFSVAFTTIILLNLLLTACLGQTPRFMPLPTRSAVKTAPRPDTSTEKPKLIYTGWAMDAYYNDSYEKMVADVRRIKEAGSNVLWISHANPARSFKNEREVGLNPAVWDDYQNPAKLNHNDSIEIVQSVWRLLKACREVGIKAVLSVGYHTQMGPDWNAANPDHVRRHADKTVWRPNAESDLYASIYSPLFQKDLRNYYNWLEYDFVSRYRDVILMLNLADEPLGGDYSHWADEEFARRNGYNFANVGSNVNRLQTLGEFQAGVMIDYMKLAAGYWEILTPDLPVTMSFDGGAMREENGLPNLEGLFQQTPANFVLTWDMYPRDRGSLDVEVNEDDITRLFFLVRAIGGYSAQYNRKVWFWSAANSWGLGQQANNPGTIADAQSNLIYLAQLMAQVGGNLEGIAIWNYNVKTQGLYNYSWGIVKNTATWNEDQMFAGVNSLLATTRNIMSEPPSMAQLAFVRPPQWQYEQIGRLRETHKVPMLDWTNLDVLARNDIATIEIGHWPLAAPPSWGGINTVVVMSPPEYLDQDDVSGLRTWIEAGGTLIAALATAQLITGQQLALWSDTPMQQPYGRGRVFVSREPAYKLFNSKDKATLQTFWQEALGLTQITDGYTVHTRTSYLHYQLGKNPVSPNLPSATWQISRYQTDGTSQSLRTTDQPLKRSEFILGIK